MVPPRVGVDLCDNSFLEVYIMSKENITETAADVAESPVEYIDSPVDISLSLDDALALQHDLQREKVRRILWYIYTGISWFLTLFLWSANWLLALVIAIAWIVVCAIRNRKHPLKLEVYFGLPGSGKTTMCAALTKDAFKRGIPTYTNVPVVGAYQLDPKSDLGFADIHDAQILIDEAGIEYNSRNFKAMPQETIAWLKLHRHYKCSVKVFSQSYNDMDITMRRLAYNFYLVRRSIIPGVFCCIPIRRSIGINQMTQEICDTYRFDPLVLRIFTTKRFIGRKYWHMFDSYDAPKLPEKKFAKWTKAECGQDGVQVKADVML